MINKTISTILFSLPLAFLLTSCGGEGGTGDGSYPLAASPSNISLTSTACGYAAGPLVTIYGGVAPYYLKNPLPRSIGLSKDRVINSGDNFKIDFIGGCFTTLPILILDSNGNSIEFEVTYTNTALR